MALPVKKKGSIMPPPGKKPGLMIAIGVPKPKDGDPDAKNDDVEAQSGDSTPSAADSKPPEAETKPTPANSDAVPARRDNPDEEAGEKADPARALVSHADENCGNCENYDPTTGNCEEVEGVYAPDDRCWAFWEAIGDEAPPAGAAGEQSGTSPGAILAVGPAGGPNQ
jgi:hypothetical protein